MVSFFRLTEAIALLILPTRELAYQIFNQIGSINCYLRTAFFRVKLCIGGLCLKEDQQGILSLNPNIIVGNILIKLGEEVHCLRNWVVTDRHDRESLGSPAAGNHFGRQSGDFDAGRAG